MWGMYSIELNMSKCTLVYGDCKIVQYCAVMPIHNDRYRERFWYVGGSRRNLEIYGLLNVD